VTRLILLLLLPASCAQAQRAEPLECAVDGSAKFDRSCRIERVESSLILHHPGGGFRRLRFTTGGLAATDGADPASVSLLPDGRTEVAVAGDRYRLPAGTVPR